MGVIGVEGQEEETEFAEELLPEDEDSLLL
jgi:hypothetical protein